MFLDLPLLSQPLAHRFQPHANKAGMPSFGADFTSDHFPQESGLEAQAVSYSKGCYLGQEVVARIHYRGQANHEARRLLFSGESPPLPLERWRHW